MMYVLLTCFLAQRLTLQVVDQFVADLKECVDIARANPSGNGHMVALYGTFSLNPQFV
jgi:hypothetical protein